MRFLRFRVYLSAPLPETVQVFLETLPGVCARKAPYLSGRTPVPPFTDRCVDAPIDMATTLLDHLTGFGISPLRVEPYSWGPEGYGPQVATVDELPQILPEVKAASYPFQKAGYVWAGHRWGGLMHWECGSGKTRFGIFFGAGDPGRPPLPSPAVPSPKWPNRRVVIVTLATTTYQWESVISEVTAPGSMPAKVITTEASAWARETPNPPQLLRVAAPTGEWIPRWLSVRQKGVQDFLVERVFLPPEGAPNRRGSPPEPGDVIDRATFTRWQHQISAFPLLSEEVTQTLLLLGEQEGPFSRGLVPKNHLSVLLSSGIVEEFTPERSSLFQVVDEAGSVVAEFTGKEGLVLPPREANAIRSKMHALETTEADRIKYRVLVGALEGASPQDSADSIRVDIDLVLRIRAEALARQDAAARSRVCTLDEHTQVCILSWQLLPSRRDFLRSWQPTTIILDESQWAKSKDIWTVESDGFGTDKWIYSDGIAGSTHYLVEGMSHVGPCPRLLELTATPAPNRIRDWWSQLQLLTRGFGKYRVFTDRYADGRMTQINENLTVYDDSGSSRTPELNARIDFWVHRVDKAEMDRYLPPLTRTITKLPAEELAHVVIPEAEWKAAKARGAQGLQELHQLHAASCKRPFVVKRALEHLQAGLKVVIFSGRILDCDLTFQDIKRAMPKIPAWCVHGETVIRDLSGQHGLSGKWSSLGQFVRDFGKHWLRMPGPAVLIGTEDVWGTGVDGLQSTHKALRAALPITPLEWEQPEGRFDRAIPANLPQISTDIEYFWASGTIDDRVMALFQDKMGSVGGTYGHLAGKMRDVVAQFGGAESEEDAMIKLAESLVSGLPESMFEDWDED